MSFVLLLFLCAVLMGVNFIGNSAPSELFVGLIIIVFSIVYTSELFSKMQSKKLAQAIVYGYMLRLCLMIISFYCKSFIHLPNDGADSEMFYYGAIRYMEAGGQTRNYFVNVMGTVFRLMGVSRLWGQFLIMLCSMVSLHFAAKILKECRLSDHVVAKVVLILALLPNVAILSSIFVREALIYMILTVSLYLFALWFTGKGEKFFLLSLLVSFCAVRFHSGTIGVPVAYLVIRFIYDDKRKEFALNAKNVMLALFFLGIATFISMRFQDILFSKFGSLESLEDIANTNELGNSSYAAYVGSSSSPLQFVLFTPLRIFFFLFSPLPIFWRGLPDVIAFCFSSMFYMWALVSCRKFLSENKNASLQRNMVLAFLIVAACTVFVFGWGTSNAGTACRHREKVSVVYGVLLALTMKEKKNMLR